MKNPLIMHVNYCEQGQSIEEICQKAAAWGYDGVEFRRKRSRHNEESEAYLDELYGAVNKSGLKQVIFGSPGPDLTSSDTAQRETEIKAALDFFKMASQRFKLTVCNTFTGPLMNPDKSIPYSLYEKHGSFTASEEQWKWAAEGFKSLGDFAEKAGFRFAFETHMNYIHDIPASAKKLVDMIGSPAAGVNLDYGNAVYFREMPSIADTISMLGEKIYYVHLKNSCGLSDGSRFPVALSEGTINHREYLKALKSIGYKGPLCIEAPRGGDREWYAVQDIAYLKSVLKDLAW